MSADLYICPTCDSEVQVGGDCPGCLPARKPRKKKKVAAVARKPWEQDECYDGLDLPDGAFDYDAFIEQEFSSKPHRRIGIKFYWWITALILLAVLVCMVLAVF